MPIITPEQIRAHLSSPPWTDDQTAAVATNIAVRQSELEAWLQVPIDPQERTEQAPILRSGLVATTGPIYRLYSVDGVEPDGDAPPPGYSWRRRYWLVRSDVATQAGTRPLALLNGAESPPRVTVHYLAGWGEHPTLVGAILNRVSAYATNAHDDTVSVRETDAKAPAFEREEWKDTDFLALRAFRLPGVYSP